MSGFSLWLLVSIRHKCQAACSCFRLCRWKRTAGSGLTQTHRFTPLHTWHTLFSCEGKRLSKSPFLVEHHSKQGSCFSQCCQCFYVVVFIFLFTFHLISKCLYLTHSLSLSLSVSSVLLDVLQFFWRHYKQNNSKHLPFSPSPFIFYRESFLRSCSIDLKLRLVYLSSYWQTTECVPHA